MSDVSYYDILGIKKDADQATIKKAYRQLAKEYHPDKNPDKTEEFTNKFKQLSEAYTILSDTEKRSIYDRFGKEGLQTNGNSGPDVDIGSMFRSMFGGGFPMGFEGMFGKNVDNNNEDLQINQELSLDELFTGKQITRTISRKCLCRLCNGTGSDDGINYTCKKCGGKKYELRTARMGNMVQHTQIPCGQCNARGITRNFTKCLKCSGTKYTTENKTISFSIPPGSKNRQTIEIQDMGHELPSELRSNNKTRGVLKVIIQEREHKNYKRYFNCDGVVDPSNLLLNLDITLCESLTGVDKTVQYLNNKELTIQTNEIIKQGGIQIVRDKGMPKYDNPDLYGDLFVQYNIIYPNSISEENKEKLKSILKLI